MARKMSEAWKRLERKAAAMLGGQRVVTKGVGGEDVTHDRFTIECKYRQKIGVYEFFDQALKYANSHNKMLKSRKKIPLLVMQQAGSPELVALRLEDFSQLIKPDANVNIVVVDQPELGPKSK